MENNAKRFQILDHRQNHRFVLIVTGKTQSCEIRQTTDMMDKALDIKLHFQSRMPIFKSKHGSPIKPEIGIKNLIIKNFIDSFVIKIFIRCKEEFHNFHSCLVRQAKLLICMSILTLFFSRAAERVVRVCFIEPIIFIQDTDAVSFNGRN